MLGALYAVLTPLTLILWARVRSGPSSEMNIWRFFLAEASAIGLLVFRDSPWTMYVLVFVWLSIFAWAYMLDIFDGFNRYDLYAAAIRYGNVALLYWAFALIMHTNITLYAPLVIIIVGLFFTYTSLGRRLWRLRLRA